MGFVVKGMALIGKLLISPISEFAHCVDFLGCFAVQDRHFRWHIHRGCHRIYIGGYFKIGWKLCEKHTTR